MRLVLSCLLLVLAVARADAAVDLNSASQTELETVPGIGPGRA
ncbi:MAG: helix-hairpin-helix domain-containing protein, partial [Betaproteobacteria bacterium]|nr:helix-hairpin-helix domain-containing protein [Betaproteobacteria bacterium]